MPFPLGAAVTVTSLASIAVSNLTALFSVTSLPEISTSVFPTPTKIPAFAVPKESEEVMVV